MTGCLKSYLTKTKPRSLISWGTTQSLALSFMSSSIGFSTLRYQDIYLAHRIQQPIMKLLIRLYVNVLYQLEQVYKTRLFIFLFIFRYIKNSVWYLFLDHLDLFCNAFIKKTWVPYQVSCEHPKSIFWASIGFDCPLQQRNKIPFSIRLAFLGHAPHI